MSDLPAVITGQRDYAQAWPTDYTPSDDRVGPLSPARPSPFLALLVLAGTVVVLAVAVAAVTGAAYLVGYWWRSVS